MFLYENQLFRIQSHKRNQHLFHRNAAVLEGVLVIIGIVVKIVGIGEKVGVSGKNEGVRQMRFRQVNVFGIANFINFFGIIVQMLTDFIA